MSVEPNYTFTTIGVVHSCYQQKFGIPRQPGLVTEATARIELLPPFNRLDIIDGLEQFSHIWVQFIFHACIQENWKAKIRPPRLGGKTKMGVFATRATHRPNPLGLSVVKLGAIYHENNKVFIELHGADLLDGTPIVDIKPYLPYVDSIADADGGFAPTSTEHQPVIFSSLALQQCDEYQQKTTRPIANLIRQIVAQDPRPSYLHNKDNRIHGIQLWDLNIKWQTHDTHFEILYLEPIQPIVPS